MKNTIELVNAFVIMANAVISPTMDDYKLVSDVKMPSSGNFTGGKLVKKQGQINAPRNAPCSCESGKKYKKCCGANK